MSTKEDKGVIEYMQRKSEKHVLVIIDDGWGERQDMDCLFDGSEHVNGSVRMVNMSSALTNIHDKYMSII